MGEYVKKDSTREFLFRKNYMVGALPLVWEKDNFEFSVSRTSRNTPTYVGKTFDFPYVNLLSEEHSHVCGKNTYISILFNSQAGTLPRMWEKPSFLFAQLVFCRNTPTYVGKTLRIYAICVNFCYLLYRNFLHFLFPLLIWWISYFATERERNFNIKLNELLVLPKEKDSTRESLSN